MEEEGEAVKDLVDSRTEIYTQPSWLLRLSYLTKSWQTLATLDNIFFIGVVCEKNIEYWKK